MSEVRNDSKRLEAKSGRTTLVTKNRAVQQTEKTRERFKQALQKNQKPADPPKSAATNQSTRHGS